MKKMRTGATVLLLCLIICGLFTGCGEVEQRSFNTLDDFKNTRLGVMTGSVYDDYAKALFPDAERLYFSLLPDLLLALDQGKIDGFIAENTYVAAAKWEGAQIDTIAEPIDQTSAGLVFPKTDKHDKIRSEINEFIIKSHENGYIDELNEKWFGDVEPTEVPDISSLSGENGTLRVALAPDLKPVTYFKNGQPSGYEVDMLVAFAEEYGYALEFHSMNFEAILAGISRGKYDLGTGAFTYTEERAESVNFSELHLTVNVLMVIKSGAEAAEASFFEELLLSFEKTFIRESRWKLLANGIGVTMLISVCSIVAGSALGFGLYMLSTSKVSLIRRITRAVARVYSRIIEGTPIIVILMILFYVVFGSFATLSGVPVAIICFSLTFGAFVYSHLAVSVSSVDCGQAEAAYALGYTKNRAFFRVIFPQAMSIFLPSYCTQAVELVKATAVVGYIAVNDLTKMGDIIRSNTYEAFFPLITTAVIYFLLTWAISSLLGLIKLRFDTTRRKKEKILKGVRGE